MKRWKHLYIGTFLAFLILASTAYASRNLQFAFPFLGRWQPSEHGVLIDEYGYQDIQNMRREGNHLQGVKGHQILTSSIIDATYYHPIAGFHFSKDDPSETHVLVQAQNAGGTASRVYRNTTAIPARGTFSATSIHTDSADGGKGRFSAAPGGNVAYSNWAETRIWGGDQLPISGMLVVRNPVESPADFWEKTYINNTSTYVELSGATIFYVGTNRRINEARFYLSTTNGTGLAGVSEYTVEGTWSSVSGFVDGTIDGGASLGKNGSMTWEWNSKVRATFVEDGDQLAYWYRFTIPAADAATAIYWITGAEGAFRHIENLWDGEPTIPGRFWYDDGSGVSNFTDWIWEDSPLSYAEINNADNTTAIVVGFPGKMRGITWDITNDGLNTQAITTGVSFWNGSEWTGVTGFYDGTHNGTGTFAQNGWMHWIPTEECSETSLETARTYQSNDLLYYYMITFSGAASPRVYPWYVTGIPAQAAKGDYKDIDEYRFPIEYQGRLFLLGPKRTPHKGIYSMYEAPDVFNGEDSGQVFFGGREAITAAGVIYNVFLATGFEQLVVTKASETYRLYGDGPENWELQQMSKNVGCVAPASFVVCEVADVQANVTRNVAIWQAAHGFVMSDGATIQDISDDIAVYFDGNDDRKISRYRLTDTVAWYDPDISTYKALITSGAEELDSWGDDDIWDDEPVEVWGVDWDNTIDYHNVELEYSLKHQEWTKVHREEGTTHLPLQIAFQTKDTSGQIYTYGMANDGNMYRLEYGSTWAGTPIRQYVHTKDMLLDPEKSMLNETLITAMRTMFVSKPTATAAEEITITHYGDGVESVTGAWGQYAPESIDMAKANGINSQRSLRLGRALKHSFKFSADTYVPGGMELSGFVGLLESYDEWSDL